MKIAVIFIFAVTLALSQNVKDREGFMVTAHQIQTTNEATKPLDESRKILFTCDYDEKTDSIKNCKLGDNSTLDELIKEFVVRDTRRVEERRGALNELNEQHQKVIEGIKSKKQ